MDFSACYRHTCSAVGLAVQQGNRRLLRSLIRKGYSIDVRDNRGWTPLHEAAHTGSYRCARELLRAAQFGHEDYVNCLTHDSTTPLYLAAEGGHLSLVKTLLHAGADVNKANNDGASPLFAAVGNGHMKVVELLVRRGSDVNHSHSVSGWSCLHQAAFKGHVEIVKFLVGVARIDAVDDYEITPLFVAAQYGQCKCLEVLADAGADVNHQSSDLATPLLIASQEGHLSCVTALLERGANANLFCNQDKWQLPIHAAAEFGRISILERLLPVTERLCDRTETELSPVYSAVIGSQPESLRVLLNAGFSPDAQFCNEYELSSPMAVPLWPPYERQERVAEIWQILLDAGARAEGLLYRRCLLLGLPSLLQLLLDKAGLPQEGVELDLLVQTGLEQLHSARHWLPLLLRAGLHPKHLLHYELFEKADSDIVNFLMEFTNWKLLPPQLLACLSHREAESTWKPRPHLASVPVLSHLCRLAVRDAVGSQVLARGPTLQLLPVPPILQGYLRFSDVFNTYGLSEQHPQEEMPS